MYFMKQETKGVVFMLLSSFFFAIMAVMVKSIPHISVPQKIFFRNLVGVFIIGSILVKDKGSFVGSHIKLLTLRSAFGLLGVAAYFYTLTKLPLSDAVLLNRMAPFFVILLSIIFLKEKVTRLQISAMVIALIGAGFVIKPQFTYTMIPALIGLSSSIFAASAYVTLRQLRLYASPNTIVFYFSAFSVLVSIPFMLLGYYTNPTLKDLVILLCIGLAATTAQVLMTRAYSYAPASQITIYSYANIIFSTIFGVILWSEFPDILSFIGGTLIILAGSINYLDKNKDTIQQNKRDIEK